MAIYSDELAEIICNRIANGESLRAICRDDDMPDRNTVLYWQNNYPEFYAKYARAREAQADYLDEQMQEVADAATPEDVQVAKLRVGTMQWRASKMAPKKYGDAITHKGDAANPIQSKVDVTSHVLDVLSLDQLEAIKQNGIAKNNAG